MLNDPKVKAEYERLEPEFRLAYILIEARSQAGLSQEALAEHMGMKQAKRIAEVLNPELIPRLCRGISSGFKFLILTPALDLALSGGGLVLIRV
ncbi:MAG: hypothetical protein K9K79_00735 [Desulfohalobiaceae bacterium]|nr:hypothetical protein [Desulfohalobiaceae bacterium]